jgi:UDP-N-acetylmuramoyl-L-alanyl-D-glutamate--2,6-diaminopimelate ligase
VRELNPRRIILIFGAGGDRDKTKRPRMGEVAGNLSDWTILTSIEHALSIGEKGDYILVAGKGHEDYQIIKDKVIPFMDADVIRSILEIKEAD